MGRLTDKVAIVTGGSRGMGEATSRLFVKEGARVLIGDVLDEQGQTLADSLGEQCEYCHLDVSNPESWIEAVARAESVFGGVDILINNAGILHIASMMETSLEDFQRLIAVNQQGPFLGMKAVTPAMKARGGGAIVNISSLEAFQTKNGLMAYTATKWAVRGMTKVAAIELGAYGIRVNSVHPGGVHTPMAGATTDEPSDEDNALYKGVALPRVGMPVEVARMSLFLASDDASYCTGAEFKVDGGWTAGQRLDILPSS
jgi:3alpha(or 20beta)-hydroxysteroid dehydrogenase